jgi:hypothetical protein
MKSVNLSKTVMALAGAAVMVMGAMNQSAEAFNFQQGDLILAIYGNRTPGEGKEVLINLSDLTPTGHAGPIGNMDALTNPAQTYTFDLSAFINAPGVIDTNPADPTYPVRYTVMGFQPDAGTGGYTGLAGSSTNLSGTVQASIGNFPNGLAIWSGNVSDTNAPNLISGQNGAVLDFTNTNSHSSRTGVSERLFNAFSVPMASNFDQLLHLIAGDSELVDNPVVFRGQALLASSGTFQITGGALAPIPVPAAIVLFGSGLIGLIGIARRNRLVP